MKKLKIGLVGAGNIACSAHLPAYQKRSDIELVAIADLNLERAKAAATKFGVPHAYASVEEMLAKEELDCVDICVWNGSHAPVAIAAAKAGKHVLCEKPMSVNVESTQRMEKAVKEAGVTFMMAMPRRFNSDVTLLMDMVNNGKLGDIYYAKTAYVRRRGTPIGWFTDMRKSGGGPVLDIGVHCIDCAWYLMGRPKPVRVSANVSHAIGNFKTKGVNRWTALDSDVTAFDTEDSAAGAIRFENGAILLFETSWAMNCPNQEYTQICGSLGGATLNPLTIYTEDNGYLTDNKLTTLPVNSYEAEIEYFLHCVRTGEKPFPSLEDGITVQKMLEGIYASAKQGREVEL